MQLASLNGRLFVWYNVCEWGQGYVGVNMAEIDALKDPLGVDKQTLKKLGIKEDTVSPLTKLSYLREQQAQLESVYWRARVDVVHATRLTQSNNDGIRAKGHERLAQHMNEVEQFYGGIEQVKALIDQIYKAHPELKED
jgi:hypothetical protein